MNMDRCIAKLDAYVIFQRIKGNVREQATANAFGGEIPDAPSS